MRHSLRLLEEREKICEVKLEALRSDIREGLESGPSEPLDIAEIKDTTRKQRQVRNTASHGA